MADGRSKRKRGRPLKLSPDQMQVLFSIVREQPLLSLNDIVYALRMNTGVRISAATARKYLAQADFKRLRPSRSRTAASGNAGVEPPAPKCYGYTDAHRDPGDSARYPCGVTDTEWEHVRHLFAPTGRPGRPPTYPRRQMLDAILYVLRTGCSWRMLPKDFPPYNSVYVTFRRWQVAGLFETFYDELRKLWRQREHRSPEPTGGVMDSQSIRTSPQGGPSGYDAGKKVKGRKRHLVTDTLGLLLAVVLTTANVQDRDAGPAVAAQARSKVPTRQKLYVDGGYAGACQQAIRCAHDDLDVEVVRHPANRNVGRWMEGQLALFDEPPRGFVVLKKRWVIERTNGWLLRQRRLIMDHDRILDVTTAWIWLAEARMLLRRLHPRASAMSASPQA